MKSRWVKPMLALLIPGLGLALAAIAGAVAAVPLDNHILGVGVVGGTCQALGAPLASGCISNSGGDAIGKHIGNGSYTLSVTTGLGSLANSDTGMCFAANGTGKITAANGDVFNFNTVGTLCEEGLPSSPYHYNGTYRITGGTGRFDDAVGGGSVTSALVRGGPAHLAIDGTINY